MLTVEKIDKTIFELIRLNLVAGGYLPDYAQMVGATPEDKDIAFQAACETIRAGGKSVIMLHGIGTGSQRDTKTKTKITINRGTIERGSRNSFGIFGFSPNGELPPLPNGEQPIEMHTIPDPVTISYDIRCVANTTKYERIIMSVLADSLGFTRKDVRAVGDDWAFTGGIFGMEYQNYVNVSATTDFFEHTWRLSVPDVVISEPVVVRIVSPIVQIPFALAVRNAIPPTGDAQPDPTDKYIVITPPLAP